MSGQSLQAGSPGRDLLGSMQGTSKVHYRVCPPQGHVQGRQDAAPRKMEKRGDTNMTDISRNMADREEGGKRKHTTPDVSELVLQSLEPVHSWEIFRLEQDIFHQGWHARQIEDALYSPTVYWGFGFFLEREKACEQAHDEYDLVVELCACIFMDGTDEECEIGSIAVREDLRGRGLGGKLLDRALQEARDRHIKACFLEVATQNVIARSLYASRGFVEVGLRKGYYPETSDDAIIMRLEL